MSNTKKLLVFTDLDGTLLDHHDYSFEAARSTLETLEDLTFPVIPTTSKTRAELLELRKALKNSHPFIVENGAAVFIPKGYFESKPDECVERGDFWVKAFGLERIEWQKLLAELPETLKECFKSFNELGDSGVAASTGLDLESASRANTRDYSEPLLWKGSDSDLGLLATQLELHKVGVVAGGRFLHLHNGYNKGIALEWLTNLYQSQVSDDIVTVALGDSDNDLEMLQAAQKAVVILNPSKEALKVEGHKEQLTSTLYGPNGWAECMKAILASL